MTEYRQFPVMIKGRNANSVPVPGDGRQFYKTNYQRSTNCNPQRGTRKEIQKEEIVSCTEID